MSTSEIIERLRCIPDGVRRYECDQQSAERRFGLSDDEMNDLVERGLPHTRFDGTRHFEYGDLHFLGVRLGTARTFLWGFSRWARSLERFAARESTTVRVTEVPQLPANEGEVEGLLHVADRSPRPVTLRAGKAVAAMCGTLHGQWPDLPATARRIVRDIGASFDFYLLPPSLYGDTALSRRSRLADCRTIAPITVEELQAAGLDARVKLGLLVSVPYATNHHWAEVRVGDAWVPVDPLTIRVLHRFGRLDEAGWPSDRSTGPLLLPLDRPRPLLTAESGGAVPTVLMTSVDEPGY